MKAFEGIKIADILLIGKYQWSDTHRQTSQSTKVSLKTKIIFLDIDHQIDHRNVKGLNIAINSRMNQERFLHLGTETALNSLQ